MISTTTLFYIYDSAVLSWLQSLAFSAAVYGSDFSSPSEVVKVTWGKRDPVYADGVADTYAPDLLATYPIVSLTSQDPEPDVSRRFYGDIFKYDEITVDDIVEVKKVRYPLPYKVTYQIDLIARNSAHIKQMYLPLLLEFETDTKYLTVNLPDPIKSKYLKLVITGINDNSDLELDDQGQLQLYRKTITLEANIWLYEDTYPNLIGRVEEFDIGFKVDSDVVNETEIIT